MAPLDTRHENPGGSRSETESRPGRQDQEEHDRDRDQSSHGDDAKADQGKNKEMEEGEEAGGEEKKPMNPILKIGLIVLGIVVLIAAIAYGIYWWTRGSYYQSTNDAYLQADQVSVAPRISGYVDEVRVGDNQNVRAGQVLVRIAARDYDARAAQARGQIAEARASMIEDDAEIRQQRAQIAQSQAQLAQTQAQERQYAAMAQFDSTQARRYRPLAASGAETSEKYDQYSSQARQSQAQLESARAQAVADAAHVEYARRQIDVYQAQKLSAQAKMEQGEAQLAAADVDVNAATVTSRIDGRVGDRTVRVGQYLQAGTRVMTIVPVQSLYVKANFKETQIGLMRVGQPASITVDAIPGIVIHGTVESFSPGTGAQFSLIPTDNATGNFTKITQRVPVRIRLDAGPQAREVLVPGMSVTAEVDTIGAKSELSAYEEENKDERRAREQEDRDANAHDRRDHTLGAGRE